ncbi:ATP-binding protein [Streptomyces sp. NPDC055239]
MQQPREREFAPHPSSVAEARTFVTDALSDWQLDGPLEDVRLCVSELATNAIKHGGAPERDAAPHSDFRVKVALDDARVRVEVHDRTQGLPAARHPGTDESDGRGLLLVSALADDWGVARRLCTGKAVWAEFAFGSTSTPPPK